MKFPSLFTPFLWAALIIVCFPSGLRAASTSGAAGDPPAPTKLGQKVEASKVARGLRSIQRDIQAYEPNQIGYTNDEGNDPFMDFTLSLLVPAGSRWRPLPKLPDWQWRPFGAATIRAGQHVFSRSSAPVVSKRFNPLIGTRFESTRPGFPDSFFDVVYAHESNGQSIASKESFEEVRATYAKIENDPEKAKRIARDDISRGWDYFGVRGEWHWPRWSLSTNLKVFMTESIPQGEKEEYKAWENDPEGKTRQSVDGFTVTYTNRHFEPVEASLSVTTGLEHAFQYYTVRGEIGSRLEKYRNPRIFLWVRYGYNSDLINYYKRNLGGGIAVSFWDPPLPPSLRAQ